MSIPIDHESLAVSRLATQFRESTNLINYIKALLTEADTLEQVIRDIIDKRWIDTAEGVQLDILGTIVQQSRIVDLETGTIQLTDEEYRLFIKNKIVVNQTHSTPEEIIAQIAFILDSPPILFTDGDVAYYVGIGKILSTEEKALLNSGIVPKTAGVNANYAYEYDYDNSFGFQGVPNSAGFGDLTDSNLGGAFASII